MDDKILRVNMTDLTTKVEAVPAAWAGYGGRALTSTIVAAEVPPTCHALGPRNKLVFAPGLLSGTAASNSGRLSIGSKSPLTGGIKETNTGGSSAQALARLGIKAVILEGQPKGDTWYSLHINKDGVTVQEESQLIGKGNFATVEGVEQRLGKKTAIIIGGARRRDEDAHRQHFGEGSRQQAPLGRPWRARRGDGLEEGQVHQHRRRGRAVGDARRPREVQGGGEGLQPTR